MLKFYFAVSICALLLITSCKNNAKKDQKYTFVFDFEQTITREVMGFNLLKNIGKDYKKEKEVDFIIQDEINRMGGVSPSIYRKVLIRMSKMGLKFKEKHVNAVINSASFTEGLPEMIAKLMTDGHQVFIVGGGYGGCNIIPKLANKLGISEDRIYSGHKLDYNIPVAPEKDEGYVNCVTNKNITYDLNWKKSEVIQKLKSNGIMKYPVVHVGDGENDLEVWQAKQVSAFIGFGLNRHSDKVKNGSKIYVTDIAQFKSEIAKILA